jgi:hypothetical protein
MNSSLIAEPARPILLAERTGSGTMCPPTRIIDSRALGVDLNGITDASITFATYVHIVRLIDKEFEAA